MYRRVWLFHKNQGGKIFEFKSESEELSKKGEGWVENKQDLKEPTTESQPLTQLSEVIEEKMSELPEEKQSVKDKVKRVYHRSTKKKAGGTKKK